MLALRNLHIWNDNSPRTGELNMAIDELLLKNAFSFPVLRFYQWSEPSVSFGYFETLESARLSFPEKNQLLQYIRRWTGGGIVDHRIDLTYTLIFPKSHPLATLRGAESYRMIHQAVAAALNNQRVDCKLINTNVGDGSSACFANPVAYDIVSENGSKLAGAGQKRSRHGLLHQGSVIGINDRVKWQQEFTHQLSESPVTWNPSDRLIEEASQLSQNKYASKEWLSKR